MCLHVKEVSTGQSPGSGHPLPADGTRLITHHQLLLFHQSEPGRKVGGKEGEGNKNSRRGGRRERREREEEREEREGEEEEERETEGGKKKKEKKVV